MALSRNVVEFSQNGEYLAYSSPDGCLKIWETSRNVLKQEYTPSSHLSAACTSLSWGPCKQNIHKYKKSRSDGISSAISDLQLIALGTLSGDILLYSFTNAELHTILKNGHSAVVNDVQWYSSQDILCSCSDDQHVIIWEVTTGKIKKKWKADNNAIHSVCVIDSSNVLCSSSTILWWDIKEMTVLKTFSAHVTEVNRLLSVKTEDSTNCYLLSAAVGDRIINAWQLDKNNTQRTVASFVLSDEPEHINIFSQKEQPIHMSVACKDGSLHVFEHTLNGKRRKPLKAKFVIQIASTTRNESYSKPIPIQVLASNINTGLNSCVLCYGSFLKPVFEKIDLSGLTENLYLVRDVAIVSAVQDFVSKIKHPEKYGNVKLLAPGHMMPLKPSQSTAKKRKQNELDIKELPMEERLKALDLSQVPENLDEQESSIKADSKVHLLLQGLQSKDKEMLHTVFQCSDETVIRNTLERLPIQSIFLVIRELHERLSKQESRTHPCLRWIKGLLAVHLPYLMSCRDVDEYLGPISQLIEARVENFAKMCQLQGCLKILLSQTSSYNEGSDLSFKPLFVYRSESSEESDAGEMDLTEISTHEVPYHTSESKESSSESSEDMES